MKLHKTRLHGVASIMALVFLVLCATLTAFLYTVMTSSIATTRNNEYRRHATLAAESGLDYLTLMLTQVSRANAVTGTTTEELIDRLREALPDQLSGKAPISGSDGHLAIGPVVLDANTSFSATVTPLGPLNPSNPSPEFKITVTGVYAASGVVAKRVIGINAEAESLASGAGGPYGIIARGDIYLPDPGNSNAGVFYNEVGSGLNVSREGTAAKVSGGSVLMFDGAEPPSSVTLPTYSDALYAKLDAANLPAFNKGAGTWKNVRIPVPANGQPYVITQNVTIEGVVYVEYGASLTFGNNSKKDQTITIKGAIIWERRGSNPEMAQTLTLGRYIGINTPVEGRDEALATVLGPSAFTTLLKNNLIVAPQTNLVLDTGNDVTGIKYFNGGVHVNNVTSAGTGNVLSKAPTTGSMVFTDGGILAEGDVTLSGNTAFCVRPPEGTTTGDPSDGYAVGIDPSTYWEQ